MKDKIAFIWQGISGRYGVWHDGLYAVMKLLEEEYDVTYLEPMGNIPEDATVLYWEAPVTIQGKDSENYKRVQSLPNKKILLFAGGQLKKDWVKGFDLVCVESKINAEECEHLGIPHITAFGINDNIFKPMDVEKVYDGIHHGACASWKRQWLVGEALGDRAVIVGRYQKEDPYPFDRCRELGCHVLEELYREDLAKLINQAHVCVQTSEYWGGGQRCTLEAMACGIPVICMTDSPKNREYVEESGFGMVVEPNAPDIKKAVEELKNNPINPQIGVDYVRSKWTSIRYADQLKRAIHEVNTLR